MATSTESARLRVVGQELEQRKISDFEVIVEQDGYRVRGNKPAVVPDAAPKPGWSLRGLFKPKPEPPCPDPEPEEESATWDCWYTHADIERLDAWYSTQRTRSGVPDDYAASQVLRVVGAYAEQRHWVLTGVSRTHQTIEIRYRDARGELQVSEQKYADLYDFGFHMSRARKAEAV